ncbi:MAG: SLC13 family permease [Dysgonomonas sp.]
MLSAIFTPLNITLLTLLVSAVFFMRGKVRSDLVALSALLILMITNILTPAEALSGFSNSVVIMMVGLFVVGGGIFRTGLAKMISSKILKLAGDSEVKLFILVMLVTAFIGAFVSNTGTVAVMLPIVVSMAASANISPKRYLMPMAFASSMGLFTLISTPPNMVIQEALVKGGYEPLGFFSFAPVGFICVAIGVVALFFLSRIFLSKDESSADSNKKKRKTLKELALEYQLDKVLHIKVADNSPIAGKNIKELRIRSEYGLNIVKIDKHANGSRFKKAVTVETIEPDTVIEAGDIIHCYGDEEKAETFVGKYGLKLLADDDKEVQGSFSDFQEAGIAEVYIMPNSRLINRTVEDTRFREEFNVTILGIQRQGEYEMNDIASKKLHSGDALLIQGRWSDIASLGDRQDDMVLVGQPLKEASKVTLDQKAPVAAGIMLLMILAMTFNIVPAVTAVLIAAVLMVVTGCLRNMEEAYDNINWESVVLIAAMLPMSLAFEKTGAAALISDQLVGKLGAYGPYVLLAGIYFATSTLTLFISNTATAVLFAPIAMQSAIGMGVSPYPFLFAVAVAASMCFASPFSTPPNALVMSAGRYTFMDYVKVGLPLQLFMGAIMVGVLPLLFPFK